MSRDHIPRIRAVSPSLAGTGGLEAGGSAHPSPAGFLLGSGSKGIGAPRTRKPRVRLPVGAWGSCRGRWGGEGQAGAVVPVSRWHAEDPTQGLVGPESSCLEKGMALGPGLWSWELRMQLGACG